MPPRVKGLAYIAVSTFCFAVMSLLVKFATDPTRDVAVRLLGAGARPVSAVEAVFWRSVLGWLGLLVAGRVLRVRRTREHVGLLALRGVLGGSAILCYFYALAHTQMSKAALIGYAYPVFAVAFAWAFIGERLGWKASVLMAVTLSGVALMLRPDAVAGFNRGDAAALIGSVMSGGAIATLRTLRRGDEATLTVVLHFTFWCTLVSLPFFAASRPALPDGRQSALLAAIAAVSAAGQLFLTAGYRHCRTSEGSMMSLLNAVFTVGFGVLLLDERLAWTTWAGGIVTLAACAALLLAGRPSAGASSASA